MRVASRVSFPGNHKISVLFLFPGIILRSRDFPRIAGTQARWKSLLAILERFLELKSAILKALIDNKEEPMMANVRFEIATPTVAGKPIKIGFEKLCSRSGILLTAEVAFSFHYWRIERTKF
ncbi:UNVERIFIED_CONTAM: hypothetical protein NCL1_60783 [Trichonephila clavipes]